MITSRHLIHIYIHKKYIHIVGVFAHVQNNNKHVLGVMMFDTERHHCETSSSLILPLSTFLFPSVCLRVCMHVGSVLVARCRMSVEVFTGSCEELNPLRKMSVFRSKLSVFSSLLHFFWDPGFQPFPRSCCLSYLILFSITFILNSVLASPCMVTILPTPRSFLCVLHVAFCTVDCSEHGVMIPSMYCISFPTM